MGQESDRLLMVRDHEEKRSRILDPALVPESLALEVITVGGVSGQTTAGPQWRGRPCFFEVRARIEVGPD